MSDQFSPWWKFWRPSSGIIGGAIVAVLLMSALVLVLELGERAFLRAMGVR